MGLAKTTHFGIWENRNIGLIAASFFLKYLPWQTTSTEILKYVQTINESMSKQYQGNCASEWTVAVVYHSSESTRRLTVR